MLSIEEAKQKAEQDRRIRLAEEKKAATRKYISTLRQQFRQLEERSSELPRHLQLGKAEFQMDPSIQADLDAQIEEKVQSAVFLSPFRNFVDRRIRDCGCMGEGILCYLMLLFLCTFPVCILDKDGPPEACLGHAEKWNCAAEADWQVC